MMLTNGKGENQNKMKEKKDIKGGNPRKIYPSRRREEEMVTVDATPAAAATRRGH